MENKMGKLKNIFTFNIVFGWIYLEFICDMISYNFLHDVLWKSISEKEIYNFPYHLIELLPFLKFVILIWSLTSLFYIYTKILKK